MADIAKINGLNLKDAAARADIARLENNLITEISSQYIRITDYATGVYKLTYNGTKYIYYNGSSNSNSVSVQGSAGAVILTINRYSTTRWSWNYINCDTYGTMYLGYGNTSTNTGTYQTLTLPSVTSGAVATTAVATTSVNGLMSSADKTKLNGLTSAGTWTVQTVTSNYWYSTSSSPAVKGTITAFINTAQKLCYLKGHVFIVGSSTVNNLIPISRLYSLFTHFSSGSALANMTAWDVVGNATFHYPKGSFSADNDYGGYVRLNDTKTALRFGRIYTTAGDLGDWGFDGIHDSGVKFDAMLIMN